MASGVICKTKEGLVLKASLMDVWYFAKGDGCVKDATGDELLGLSFNLPPFPFPLNLLPAVTCRRCSASQAGEGAVPHPGRNIF